MTVRGSRRRRRLVWWTAGAACATLVAAAALFAGRLQDRAAVPEQPGPAPAQKLVAEEIRYRAPAAARAWLAWGVDGWQPVPPAIRAPGTLIRRGVMNTPMRRDGDAFVAVIRAPSGATIDYGFRSTHRIDGVEMDIWEGDREDGYQTLAAIPGVIEVVSRLSGGQMPVAADTLLVTDEIRYHRGDAARVSLVWGVDGWHLLPDGLRPPGTAIHDSVMHTAMTRTGGAFVATVRVPALARVQYGFLATLPDGGVVWDGGRDFVAAGSRVLDIQSSLGLEAAAPPAR